MGEPNCLESQFIFCCTFLESHTHLVCACCILVQSFSELEASFLPLTFAFTCWTSSSVGNRTIDRHKGGIPLKSNGPCLTAQNQAHAHTTNHTYTLCWQILIWWFSSQPMICQIKVTANISSHTVAIRTNLCGQRKSHQKLPHLRAHLWYWS